MGGKSSGGWDRLGDIQSLEEKAKAALRGTKRNVFISFAHEDVDEVNLLRAQAKNEKNDIDFNDHSVTEPYGSKNAEYIQQKIAERIARSSATVIFLSTHTGDSEWVQWEVSKSQELGKDVVAVYSESKPKPSIPTWISSLKIRVMPWAKLMDELR